MDAREERITWTATHLLTIIWSAAERFGLCPICLFELMRDMVEQAEENGTIRHEGDAPDDDDDDDMGEPLTDTLQ